MKRPVLIAFAATFVAVAGAVALWMWQPWAPSPAGAAGTQTGAPSTQPFTEPVAQSLAADLTSGDQNRIRNAVTVSPDQQMDPATITELNAVRVTFEVATFKPTGDTTATVKADVAGTAPWLVTLVLTDGKWKVSTTEPAS
ncbi:hypothetical protein [Amycolatopsis vastitatis]|uniref:hypothetical protein n=1 Tax=Amycolatopsis vastitatis TaxID=1905142 RepID=UPI001177E6A5|nr:hypothetical protein [Amycolatopsis vastitatis]